MSVVTIRRSLLVRIPGHRERLEVRGRRINGGFHRFHVNHYTVLSGGSDVPGERVLGHRDVNGLAILQCGGSILRGDIVSYTFVLYRKLQVTDGEVAEPGELELVLQSSGDFLLINRGAAHEHLVGIEHCHLDRCDKNLDSAYFRRLECGSTLPLCGDTEFQGKLLVHRKPPSFGSPCIQLLNGKTLAELARIHIGTDHGL